MFKKTNSAQELLFICPPQLITCQSLSIPGHIKWFCQLYAGLVDFHKLNLGSIPQESGIQLFCYNSLHYQTCLLFGAFSVDITLADQFQFFAHFAKVFNFLFNCSLSLMNFISCAIYILWLRATSFYIQHKLLSNFTNKVNSPWIA